MKPIFFLFCSLLISFSISLDLTGYRVISLPATSPILVSKNEKVAIRLKSNPSTGYEWFIKNENSLDVK